MVFVRENPIDRNGWCLGVPLFQETSICPFDLLNLKYTVPSDLLHVGSSNAEKCRTGFQCQLLIYCRYEIIISDLCENLDSLDEPDAKAAMIWIVGEYAERSPGCRHVPIVWDVQLSLLTKKTELAEELSLETRNQGKDGDNSGTIQFSSVSSVRS